MKKRLAFVMIALLICSLFGTYTVVGATNTNPPTFVVGTAQGGRGDTVTVTVSTVNNPGIVSLKLDIGYDADVMKLQTIKGGVFDAVSFGPVTNNPIAVGWVDAVNPNNTTNGVIATLTFTIKDDAPLGKSAVTVTYTPDDVYDFDFENVAFTNADGWVTVEQTACKHTYDNACDTDCNVCNEKRETTHSYGTGNDTICDVCGYTRPTVVKPNISSSVYTIEGTTIRKISVGTTVATLLNGIHEKETCQVFKDGKVVASDATVGTGMVVNVMDGSTVKASYTVIVTGDTNGDGNITVTDMLSIKAHVLKKSILTDAYAAAADTNGDNGISVTDFIQVKAKILGKGDSISR